MGHEVLSMIKSVNGDSAAAQIAAVCALCDVALRYLDWEKREDQPIRVLSPQVRAQHGRDQ
jgi:hypothetical protein